MTSDLILAVDEDQLKFCHEIEEDDYEGEKDLGDGHSSCNMPDESEEREGEIKGEPERKYGPLMSPINNVSACLLDDLGP